MAMPKFAILSALLALLVGTAAPADGADYLSPDEAVRAMRPAE